MKVEVKKGETWITIVNKEGLDEQIRFTHKLSPLELIDVKKLLKDGIEWSEELDNELDSTVGKWQTIKNRIVYVETAIIGVYLITKAIKKLKSKKENKENED